MAISSLGVYVMIEPETPAVVVYRRADQGFVREVYEGMESVVLLGDVAAELPLAEVYEGVEFGPEPD